ncbi:amino acid permease-domain-containing protein [Peziza echinospora]|nr:amino acid permease-domain-containing protein [Peziza echinospora]
MGVEHNKYPRMSSTTTQSYHPESHPSREHRLDDGKVELDSAVKSQRGIFIVDSDPPVKPPGHGERKIVDSNASDEGQRRSVDLELFTQGRRHNYYSEESSQERIGHVNDTVESTKNRRETSYLEVSAGTQVGGERHDLAYTVEPVSQGSIELQSDGGSNEGSNTTTKPVAPAHPPDLELWDLFTLNINHMIGQGIFITPGVILSLTDSKAVSLAFWIIGGIYTILCTYMNIDFWRRMPSNGGEIIYIDDCYSSPEILVAVIFGGSTALLTSNGYSCLAFAKHVLLSSWPEEKQFGIHEPEFDQRILSFIAIVVLVAICILHFFSRRFSLMMNTFFGLYKVLFLIVTILSGFIAINKQGSGRTETWGWNGGERPPIWKLLSAFFLVLYSYQGANGFNYVGGEIGVEGKVKNFYRYLTRGPLISVWIVTILYILVNVAFFLALPFHVLTEGAYAIPRYFGATAFGGRNSAVGMNICIALSILGHILATTYTFSRAKQAVARQRLILPMLFSTTGGGLVLHCILSLITILLGRFSIHVEYIYVYYQFIVLRMYSPAYCKSCWP